MNRVGWHRFNLILRTYSTLMLKQKTFGHWLLDRLHSDQDSESFEKDSAIMVAEMLSRQHKLREDLDLAGVLAELTGLPEFMIRECLAAHSKFKHEVKNRKEPATT